MMDDQQQSDPSMALSYNAFMQDKGSLNQLRLDTESELFQTEQLLRGYNYNSMTKDWEKTDLPMMNDNGIKEIMFLLRSHANKVVYLSNFDENTVGLMMHNFSCALSSFFSFKCDEYAVRKNMRTTIQRSLENFGWATILRAMHDMERTHMDTINRVVEQVVQREMGKGGSFGVGLMKKNDQWGG